jgi:hypothetical protein
MSTFLGSITGVKEDSEKSVLRATLPSKCRDADMCSYALERIAYFEYLYGSSKRIQARKKSLLKRLYSYPP